MRPANPTVATETRREPPRFTILTGQRQLRIQDRSAIWGSIDSRGSWSHLPRFFIDCAKHCIVRIYLYFVGQKNGDEGQCPSVMSHESHSGLCCLVNSLIYVVIYALLTDLYIL